MFVCVCSVCMRGKSKTESEKDIKKTRASEEIGREQRKTKHASWSICSGENEMNAKKD